tara:strand:- start:1467 stop:2744 length:1278 start_codon:yes stop_codon:yes gene_type:complete
MSNTHWKAIRLDEFCDLVLDCVNKTAPTVEYDTGFKMIRTTNVKDGYVSLHGVRHVTSEVYEKWTRRGRPKSGDVIMTREAPLGEVGLLRDATGVFLGQRLVMYRSNPNTNEPKFLLYALMGQELQSQIKAYGSGSTVEHMRVPDCSALLIKTPPLPTQKKIASILSAYDDLIENNNRRIKILEEMAQNIYREWFVHFRYPGHEDVPLVDSELGQIPQGWEVKRLGDVLRTLESGRRPKGGASNNPYGVPSIGAENVIGLGQYDFSKEKYVSQDFFEAMNSGVVNENDVLLYKDGAQIGRKTLFRKGFPHQTCCVNEHVFILRAKDECSQLFMYLWLDQPTLTEQIRQLNSNSAQPGINRDGVKGLPILLPTSAVLELFSSAAEPLIDQIFVCTIQNQNLRKTRDLLLPKLISGQLDVEELDIKV